MWGKVLFLVSQNCGVAKFYQIPRKVSRDYPDTSTGISQNVNTFEFQAIKPVLGLLKNDYVWK